MTGKEIDGDRTADRNKFSSVFGVLRPARKYLGGTALVVSLLIIVGLWMQEWFHRRFEAFDTLWFGGGRTGLIMIDTPQVYTRERLVNDRFREAAWLEQRLADTDTLLAEHRFRQPDLFLTAIRELKLRASKTEPANQNDPSKPALVPAPDPQDLHPSPQDEFEDVMRYREAIRESLMTMQLDDRHDIAGNTIYRLNFRASIVPEPGTRKLAVITVQLAQNNSEPSSYFDLLYDWRDELQRQIIDLVDDKTNTLVAGSELIAAEQRELLKYIDDYLRDHQMPDFWNEVYWPVFEVRRKKFHETVLSILQMTSQPADATSILTGYRDVCSRKLEQSGSPQVFLEPAEIEAITGGATNGRGQNVPCLVFGLNEFLLKMDAAYILEFLMEDAHVESGTPGSCNAAEVIRYVLIGSNEFKCKEVVRVVQARWEHISERMRRQGLISSFTANALLKEKEAGTSSVGGRSQLRLKDFFRFDAEACASYCYPIVDFQTSNSDSGCFTRESNSERAKTEPVEILARCLKEALSRAGVATYAVTPDEAVQRLELLEKEALVMDAADGSVLSFGGREVAETAALEREPVAFGIGDWGSTIDPAQGDTKFAWIILPRRRALSGGRFEQTADHVSVSAMVSTPSWWKSVILTVTTCWLDPTELVGEADPDTLCTGQDVDGFAGKNNEPKFEVALPGNASEVMTKLRFDVLTFPYLFGQRQYQNVLEVGRKGSLIILGGRLWRSPKVIMGNQIADRIEVLPDMDGIVAHFDCIQPYPGTPGVPKSKRDENFLEGSGAAKASSVLDSKSDEQPDENSDSRSSESWDSAPLRAVVWTSEGRTGYLNVEIKPYRQRAGEQAEKPCWLPEDEDKGSGESSG